MYNTYQIPFINSVRITITHWETCLYYYIVRGLLNYPFVSIGNLVLPLIINNTNSQASHDHDQRTVHNSKYSQSSSYSDSTSFLRLNLYKRENILLSPLEFLTIANVSNMNGENSNNNGIGGLLYQVTLEANSSDYLYLEGCFRAKIDDAKEFEWLSSGTEDFFLSAYYFNRGLYHGNDAGCTFFDGKGSVSAYKFFENDPVVYKNNLQLLWRCSETQYVENGCPHKFNANSSASINISNNWNNLKQKDYIRVMNKKGNLKLADTNATVYVWIYEYEPVV